MSPTSIAARRCLLLVLVVASALASTAGDAAVVRQPYLQLGTPSSVTVVWRTNTAPAGDSLVEFGTVLGTYDQSATATPVVPDPTFVAGVWDHVVEVSGLPPGTKYFYRVGTTGGGIEAGGTADHFFVTSPPTGPAATFSAWVVGDSGNNSQAQRDVRDAMIGFTTGDPPDLFIHVGDIAYENGTDGEWTTNHFAPYANVQRSTVFWPAIGNHDSFVAGFDPGVGTGKGPYFDAHVLPAAAEAGGVASGTESYYSFDYANVHFVALNSHDTDATRRANMLAWLEADLQATTQQWLVAFWHHPPYSKGSHDSDNEAQLVWARENVLPILEANGVDLVLTGHSHNYERSCLVDSSYDTPTPSFATLLASGNVLDAGDGDPAGDGPYVKAPAPNDGAVYIVAGHGGRSIGGTGSHPVMCNILGDDEAPEYGSALLRVDGNTLTVQGLLRTGAVNDTFTMVKADWAAYNDLNDGLGIAGGAVADNAANGDGNAPNVTGHDYFAVGAALRNFFTGDPLAVTMTGLTGTDPTGDRTGCSDGDCYDPQNNDSTGAMGAVDSGTDAHVTFDGNVDYQGVHELDAPDWDNVVEFENLDPNKTYSIALTANRNEATYAGARFTRVTILGADGFTNESTPGVVVNAPDSVSFSTGFNPANGYVARWTNVDPGPDGRFAILSEWDDSLGAGANNTKGYAMGVFELMQFSPPGAAPPAPTAGDLIISGVQAWNDPAGQSPGEFVEIFNTTGQTLSLEGLELISRVDTNADGVLDVDWELSADLTGATIAPYSFFSIGEAGVAAEGGAPDVVASLDLATGEGGSAERAISLELVLDGEHMDYVVYGRHDGSDTAALPPGDQFFDGVSFPRSEVLRNTRGTASFQEGLLRRESADDLFAGHAVDGYYTDEAALGDGFPAGVWTSPHDETNGAYVVRSAASAAVPPPGVECTADAQCDDADLCTLDACVAGTCVFDPVTCGAGESCEPTTGMCELDPVVASFQQGVGGYGGTVDTFLQSNSTTANNSVATTLVVDRSPEQHILMRFGGLFGGAPGQIPAGSTILSAELEINVTNTSAQGALLHRMLQPWNDTDSWNTWGGGIQADGAEARAVADATEPGSGLGPYVIDVTASLAAWALSPASNHGWAWIPPVGDDSWQFDSAEGGTPPALTVTYLPPEPVVATFQQEMDGYLGTQDTTFQQASPANVNGALEEWEWDDNDPNGSGNANYGLLRFDEIFGPGPGQVPAGAQIVSATLAYTAFDPGVTASIHEMLTPWDESDSLTSACGASCGDDYDVAAVGAADSDPVGTYLVDVTSSLQAWALDPASNQGWIFVPPAPGGDGGGSQVRSSEYQADPAQRPALTVEYFVPILPPMEGDLVISGLQAWNDPAGQSPGEFVEIFNTTGQTFSLEGLELISRVDTNADGVLDTDWELAADLTGATIAPHSFFSIGESGVVADGGGPDVVADLDLATGEGGSTERAISVELVLDGTHMDYVVYGRHDGSDTAALPPGDQPFDGVSFPRSEVVRNTRGTASFQEGVLRRVSADDLYAGHDVDGYYTDEAALGDGFPAGVWTSPHDETNGAYVVRSGASAAVLPPGAQCTVDEDCADADLCTVEACVAGTCVSDPVVCPEGESCEPSTGMCEVLPVTVGFQQGVGGYGGTRDTFLQSNATGANNAAATTLVVDRSPEQHILMRFDGIFGDGPGQVPAGSSILSAELQVQITNASIEGALLHRMLQTWNDTDSWDTWGSGIQANDVEARAIPDATEPGSATGPYVVDVTTSLAAWSADPSANHGWAWIPPVNDDSWQMGSAESGTPPILTVTYGPPAVPLATGDVIVSAIQTWNNPGADDPGEFIELFNTTSRTISLEGLEIVSRVDADTGDGVVDVDFTLSADLSGASIAPYSFFLIAESDVDAENGVRDVVADLDFMTGEGGVNERAGSVQLLIDGVHMDYVVYGWDGAPSPAGELPPGDVPFEQGTDPFPRPEVIRNTTGTDNFTEGLLRRESAEDLFAGHAVLGYYTDEDALGDGYPNGVWTSPHDEENDAYQARNSTSAAVAPLPGPNPPMLVSPLDGEEGVALTPELRVHVTHSDGLPMDVTFFGREPGAAPGEDFTIVHFSDTQFYAESFPAIFDAITQWIADEADSRNIVFAPLSGDCVQNADQIPEWLVADAALSTLEAPMLPDYPEGVPWLLAPGNHDQDPNGSADTAGATDNYNTYFGESRFLGRSYYGGHFGSDNDNNYALFSGGGLDFIVIFMEYDTSPDPAVLQWAADLLKDFPERRGIVVSHYIMNAGSGGSFGTQGQAIFNALEDNPNLFLILAGHIHAEGIRTDVGSNGNTIYTLLADYQDLPNGGNGWIRLLNFSPANNQITVETYSPVLDAFGTDTVMGNDTTSATFTLGYDMGGSAPFQELGSAGNVPSGTDVFLDWPALEAGGEHEWYVELTDGVTTVQGPIWRFTTACDADAQCDDGDACTGAETCEIATGLCQPGTPVVCSPGSVCAPETGMCVLEPVDVAFQDGVGGYTSTVDTFFQEAAPGNVNGALAEWEWDDNDPNGSGNANLGLLRFDGLFGGGPGQIPPGSQIQSATLTYTVFDVGVTATVHEMLADWDEGDSLTSTCGAACDSGVDYAAGAVASAPAGTAASFGVDVTASLQAWVVDPAANRGWIFVPPPPGGDGGGAQVRSREYGTTAQRPLLQVTYLPAAPCTSDADCNDGNLCTDDVCNLGTELCEFVPNTDPCDDGIACSVNDQCGGGSCQPGAPDDLLCDDTDVCTDDVCNVAVGCEYSDNTAPCDDGASCTSGDVCGAGVCAGADDCPVGEVCDVALDLCVVAPTTVAFQQGAAYGGTVDTMLQQDPANADSNNASSEALGWDDDDPSGSGFDVYTLIRFAGVFGSGPGQVPVGATIDSAVLTYTVGAASGGPEGDDGLLHEVLIPWAESVSWNGFGGDPGASAGDEYDPAVVVNLPATGAGTFDVDVTESIQRWADDPASNQGWIVLPTGTNGVDLRSSEYTGAPGERPVLTVTYLPGPACLADADCDDGIACTDDVCDVGSGLCTNTPSCPVGASCNVVSGVCVLGETFCDSFDRAGPALGPDWEVETPAFEVQLGQLAEVAGLSFQNSQVLWTGAAQTASQFGRFQVTQRGDNSPGLIFRGNPDAGGAGPHYEVHVGSSEVRWEYVVDDAFVNRPGLCALPAPLQDGDWFGARIAGAGDATVVEAFVSATPLDADPNNWPAPVCVLAGDPANPVDSGDRVGIRSYSSGDPTPSFVDDVCLGDFFDLDCSVAADCDDGNPCTDDLCTAGVCEYAANTASCDDGDACTVDDTCNAGVCEPVAALVCDDGEFCTVDGCDSAVGCVFDPAPQEGVSCENGDFCDGAEVCQGGVCADGADPCVAACDEGTDTCLCVVDGDCEDGDLCTVDTCEVGGACSSAPVVCGGGDVCNPETGACEPAPTCGDGTLDPGEECDDGNTLVGDGCSDVCESEGPFTDTFDRSDRDLATDATWLVHSGSFDIVSNELVAGGPAFLNRRALYIGAPAGLQAIGVVRVVDANGNNPGLIFRGDGPASPGRHYQVFVTAGGELRWELYDPDFVERIAMVGGVPVPDAGDYFRVRLVGTGLSTEVAVWIRDSYPANEAWGTPDVTVKHPGGALGFANSGEYVGIRDYSSAATPTVLDDFQKQRRVPPRCGLLGLELLLPLLPLLGARRRTKGTFQLFPN